MVTAVVGQSRLGGAVKGEVADENFSGIRLIQSAQQIEQGALPAAAGTGDRDEFPAAMVVEMPASARTSALPER